MVDTNRSLIKYIVFSFITCGIYGFYFIYKLAQDMNIICAGDGEETPGLLVYILLCIVTCGIYQVYWLYKIGNRLQNNAPRYGLRFEENGVTILLWYVIGYITCGIGFYVAMYFIIRNINALASAYIFGNHRNNF